MLQPCVPCGLTLTGVEVSRLEFHPSMTTGNLIRVLVVLVSNRVLSHELATLGVSEHIQVAPVAGELSWQQGSLRISNVALAQRHPICLIGYSRRPL